MTAEKAWSRIEYKNTYNCEHRLCDLECEKCNEAMKMAIEALQKYRWHDLRLRPDDLPDLRRNIIFATTDGCVQEGEFCNTYWIQYRFSAIRKLHEVVAWRNIETFED